MEDHLDSREDLLRELARLRSENQELHRRLDEARLAVPETERALMAALHLAESRSRELEAVIGSVPDGLVVFDRYAKSRFMNEQAKELYRLMETGVDDAVGEKVRHIFNEFGQPVTPDDALVPKTLKSGRTIQDVVISTRPDRKPVVYLSTSSAPIMDADGAVTGAVLIIRDITRHRESDQKVAFQSHLLECVSDAVIATDADLKLTYWNERAESLFGWSAAEALGHTTRELLHPVLPEKNPDDALGKLLAHDFYFGEVIYHHKDGTAIPVENRARLIRDSQGSVRETVTSIRDIRERRKAEAVLRQQDLLLRTLIRNSPELLFIKDRNSRVVLLNDAYGKAFGVDIESLIGKNDLEIYGDDDAARQSMENDRQVMQAGEPHMFEEEAETPDGRAVYLISKSPWRNDDGDIIGIVGSGMNITERKRLDAQLRRLADELAIANSNKSHFLSVLSHELRNPLAAIVASLDLLAHVCGSDEKALRAVHVAKRQSGHLTRLVDDLLDVTRITTNKVNLKLKPIDLAELIRHAVADFSMPYRNKGVTLTADEPGSQITLEADPDRLAQAIGNLLHNALKFTPADGRVHIGLEVAMNGQGIREAVISVQDSGIGVAPDMLPRLFEPFSQAEQSLARSQGGLGLGLSIVKGIIALHGGSISVHSDGLGKGTCMILRLPLEPEKSME